jgi:hypothetical protein
VSKKCQLTSACCSRGETQWYALRASTIERTAQQKREPLGSLEGEAEHEVGHLRIDR